ncbi:MAG: PfkB family carbohydrate kinase [Candidatus Sumerlaeota bacterium]
MSLLIIGSIALDTVETPDGDKAENAIGGSAVYGAYAASLFTKPSIVGVVGDDFPTREMTSMKKHNIDLEGVEQVPKGRTFNWGGRYFDDMNQRETLFTELGVFENFQPKLPEKYKKIRNVFLANIDPDLQHEVLEQISDPRFVVVDTMNLWIDIKHRSLLKLLKKIDVLLLNDEEAMLLADTTSVPRAAEKLQKMGLERVLIKKGEHGCVMHGPEGVFSSPALPLTNLKDPTGAGDSFAGGMLGWLSERKLTENNWRKAILLGTATASFCCESFSVQKLRKATKEDVIERAERVRAMMQVGKI